MFISFSNISGAFSFWKLWIFLPIWRQVIRRFVWRQVSERLLWRQVTWRLLWLWVFWIFPLLGGWEPCDSWTRARIPPWRRLRWAVHWPWNGRHRTFWGTWNWTPPLLPWREWALPADGIPYRPGRGWTAVCGQHPQPRWRAPRPKWTSSSSAVTWNGSRLLTDAHHSVHLYDASAPKYLSTFLFSDLLAFLGGKKQTPIPRKRVSRPSSGCSNKTSPKVYFYQAKSTRNETRSPLQLYRVVAGQTGGAVADIRLRPLDGASDGGCQSFHAQIGQAVGSCYAPMRCVTDPLTFFPNFSPHFFQLLRTFASS